MYQHLCYRSTDIWSVPDFRQQSSRIHAINFTTQILIHYRLRTSPQDCTLQSENITNSCCKKSQVFAPFFPPETRAPISVETVRFVPNVHTQAVHKKGRGVPQWRPQLRQAASANWIFFSTNIFRYQNGHHRFVTCSVWMTFTYRHPVILWRSTDFVQVLDDRCFILLPVAFQEDTFRECPCPPDQRYQFKTTFPIDFRSLQLHEQN